MFISSFIITFLIILISTYTGLHLLIWCKKVYKRWTLFFQLPGPPGYPIIGNVFHLTKPPDELFEHLRLNARKYYPIYKEWAFNHRYVHVRHPEDIKIILSTSKVLKKQQFVENWLGSGLLTSNGSLWQHRRKLLSPVLLHFKTLQNFTTVINTHAKNLVEKFNSCDFIEVCLPVSQFILHCAKEAVIGNSKTFDANFNEFFDALNDVEKFVIYRMQRPWIYRQAIYDLTIHGRKEKECVEVLHGFTSSVLNEKIEKKVSNYVTILESIINARNKGFDVDDNGIREEVDTFIATGYHTTGIALQFLLMVLANHEDIQQKIFEEISTVFADTDESPRYEELKKLKYMECCIMESLRLFPSIPVLFRRAMEDINTYTGFTIPEGSHIAINLFDLHRDPNYFDNPDKFDPNRFFASNPSTAYMPFSIGPRICIGRKIAVLELKIALCMITKKFVLRPHQSYEDAKFVVALGLRTKEKIRIKFVPRTIK